ncbi:MAG: zf-TFIIB domain-containing protein [Ilumatobacter sp.]|uniref:TFIIB-type zinc ribbon-containing protein n=1 Tax=Ilumatobacter sp. TaxID=1967498 RepID=UPI003297E653
MHCPLCLDTVLDITFHAGIELDICPRCRGVWLDRGELDRLGSDNASRPRREHSDRSTAHDDGYRDDRFRNDEHRSDRRSKRTRKKRLSDRLGDVFEEIIDL